MLTVGLADLGASMEKLSIKEISDVLRRAWLGTAYAPDVQVRTPANALVKYYRAPWDPPIEAIVGLISADKGVDNVHLLLVELKTSSVLASSPISSVSCYTVRTHTD
jgi:hypothetical protein